MNPSSVLGMGTVYPYSICATERQIVPMATTKIRDYAPRQKDRP